jgi:alpha-L-fucosidase 2
VNITWKQHQLSSAIIKSLHGNVCKLRTDLPVKITGVTAKSEKTEHGYVTRFQTQKGKVYQVTTTL